MTTNKQTFSAVFLPVEQSEWIQIFPAGKVRGFDGRGPYVLEDAQAVVTASVRPLVELAVDRDHVTDVAPPGTPTPAAGWIKELKAEAGAIYARIEWTPPAQQQLKNKEYRYISPTFLYEPSGRVTRILRASLTNDPNFEMKAVAAADREPTSSTQTETINMDNLAQDLAALLGLEGEAISAEAILEAVKTLQASVDAVKEAVDAPEEATTPEAIVEAVEGHVEEEVKKEVASQVKKATAAAKAGAPDPAKYVPVEVVTSMQEQLSTLTKDANQSKATAAVDQALKAGKLVPAQREWALGLAAKDAKAFADFVKAAPTVLIDSGIGQFHAETASAQHGLDPVQASVAAQTGVAPEAFKAAKA